MNWSVSAINSKWWNAFYTKSNKVYCICFHHESVDAYWNLNGVTVWSSYNKYKDLNNKITWHIMKHNQHCGMIHERNCFASANQSWPSVYVFYLLFFMFSFRLFQAAVIHIVVQTMPPMSQLLSDVVQHSAAAGIATHPEQRRSQWWFISSEDTRGHYRC